jgi:hypothetical protein
MNYGVCVGVGAFVDVGEGLDLLLLKVGYYEGTTHSAVSL